MPSSDDTTPHRNLTPSIPDIIQRQMALRTALGQFEAALLAVRELQGAAGFNTSTALITDRTDFREVWSRDLIEIQLVFDLMQSAGSALLTAVHNILAMDMA